MYWIFFMRSKREISNIHLLNLPYVYLSAVHLRVTSCSPNDLEISCWKREDQFKLVENPQYWLTAVKKNRHLTSSSKCASGFSKVTG
jgi:hypothetical protein